MNRKQKIISKTIKFFIYFSAFITFALLIWIVGNVLVKGLPLLNLAMFELTSNTDNLSMMPAIINTLTVIIMALVISVPIGIFTAIYLVEYAKKGSIFVKVVRTATETLQGIPSIVYGLFGYIFFVRILGLGYSLLSGTLTLSIMILPLIIRSTEEALLAVDNSLRAASFALGARKLRTIFQVVLPPAINGIISGVILGIGRIFGETAALQFTAGTAAQIASPNQQGATLSVFMYNLTAEGRHTKEAYASALVLLIVAILINFISTRLGSRLGRK